MKCTDFFVSRLLLLISLCSLFFQSNLAQAGEVSDKLTGVVEIVYVEYIDNRKDSRQYFINVLSQATPIRLVFKTANLGHIYPGLKVDVRGITQGGLFYVDEIKPHITTRTQKKSNTYTDKQFLNIEDDAAAELVTKRRKAVALLVDMGSLNSVSSATDVAGYMYDNQQSMAGQFEASSRGQLVFQRDTDGDSNADVFGPFNINAEASKNCNYYSWATDVEKQAKAAGINLGQYQHKVFVLPNAYSLKQCGWEGIANLGCGDNCRAWVAGTGSGIYTHELGHNLGMHHSGVDFNNDDDVDNNYGDYSGVMGSVSHLNLFNAPHQAQMGWFAAFPNSELDVTGKGSISYSLGALEMDPRASFPGLQLLTHFRAGGGNYYISFRQDIGGYGVNKQYANKLSIHSFVGGSKMTYFIKALPIGATFIDSDSGFSVTFHGFNGSFADVSIISKLESDRSCVRNAPSLKLSPPTQSGSLTDNFIYTLSITNNDGIYCDDSLFSLNTSESNSLDVYLSRRNLNIAPGNSGNISLSVNAEGLEKGGRYEFLNSVTSTAHQEKSLTGVVIIAAPVVINKPEPMPPSGPENLRGIRVDSGLRLNWSAPENSSSEPKYYRIFRNGKQIASSRRDYFLDGNLVPKSTYKYYIDVLYFDRSVSAPSKTLEYTAPRKRRWWRG